MAGFLIAIWRGFGGVNSVGSCESQDLCASADGFASKFVSHEIVNLASRSADAAVSQIVPYGPREAHLSLSPSNGISSGMSCRACSMNRKRPSSPRSINTRLQPSGRAMILTMECATEGIISNDLLRRNDRMAVRKSKTYETRTEPGVMFSFFGLFADRAHGLREQICETWPLFPPTLIDTPMSAFAVRFGRNVYDPADENIPDSVYVSVRDLSAQNPACQFLLLRTECFGGDCENWGCIFLQGEIVCDAKGNGALRQLLSYFGVQLGPTEIFEPLRRDFPWLPPT